MERFPPEVAQRLGHYVYRLVDPRNGETFYVGKGSGDRVFQHALEADETLADNDQSLRLRRIREIKAVGLSVIPIIHRHGLTAANAFLVEAALIDVYAGLANRVGGHGSGEYGVAHAEELIAAFKALPFEIRHRLILISVSQSILERPSVYDAVRYAWRLSLERAKTADYVLAHRHGLVLGAFVAEEWFPALMKNFPLDEDLPERWGFTGREAPRAICDQYVGRRVPDFVRQRGAANPVRFLEPDRPA